MRKYLLAIAGLAAVLVLGILIDAESGRGMSTNVPTATGEYRIFAAGLIEGAAPEADLRFEHAGRVRRVLVREGQQVAAGEPMVELDDVAARQEVALAAAELEMAEARLEGVESGARAEERKETQAEHRAREAEMRGAEQKKNRILSLRHSGAVTQQEADDETVRHDAARARLEAAEARRDLLSAPPRTDELRLARAGIAGAKARWEQARHDLDRTTLRAPYAGQVLKVDVEEGELAGPAMANPSVVIADTSRMFVRAFVEEIDAPRVLVGMPARATADGLDGREFIGRVTRLAPRMQSKRLLSDRPNERLDTKVREVWIELEEGRDLVVGLRVDVVIEPADSVASIDE